MNNPNTLNDNHIVANPSTIVVESDYTPITQNELLDMLKNVQSASFVHLAFQTIPSMSSTNNPFYGRVSKITEGNFLIGANYETLVNNRMYKEDMAKDFIAQSSSVGEHISSCVQFNKKLNRYYLQYITFENSISISKYFVDGVETSKETLKPYFSKSGSSSRQPQENKIDVKSLKVSNITKIHIAGMKYQVIG